MPMDRLWRCLSAGLALWAVCAAGEARGKCLQGEPLAPGDHVFELQFAGNQRNFLLHVPPGYDGSRPTPVVFDIHGFGSNALMQIAFSGSDKVADEHGFLLVAPNGYFNSWNGDIAFGTAFEQGLDDVGLIKAIVEQVAGVANVDRGRVYATGLSNGAAMTNTLGCQAADVFAAIAPVADPLDIGAADCLPARPISVLGFHGYDDEFVPYEGGAGDGPPLPAPFPSIPDTLATWATIMGCTGEAEVTPVTGQTKCEVFKQCDGKARVGYCSIEGTHVLYAQDHMNIAEAAWDFFSEVAMALPDADGDGIFDGDDNCVYVANQDQEDANGDCVGDACECETAVDCDDGAFCNGAERCDDGVCGVGNPPCAPESAAASAMCDEVQDLCGAAPAMEPASNLGAGPSVDGAQDAGVPVGADSPSAAAENDANATGIGGADVAITPATGTVPVAEADTMAATGAAVSGAQSASALGSPPLSVAMSGAAESGCGCRIAGRRQGGLGALYMGAALLGGLWLRRRWRREQG